MRLTRILTLRSIIKRSTRFLLSAFGIILGVAGLLSIRTTNQTALNSIVSVFESTSGKAKLMVTSTNVDESGFSQQVLSKLELLDEIEVANPLIIAQTDLAGNKPSGLMGMSFLGSGGGGIMLHGIIPSLDMQTREYTLTDGEFLGDDLDKGEVVLGEALGTDDNIKVGDRISFLTPFGSERLKVVGFISREGPGQVNNGRFGVIPYITAQEMFDRGKDIDQIDIVTTNPNPDKDELAAIRLKIQELLGDDYSVTYPSGQGERMTQMLQNYQIGLNFMSGVSLFVGAFLIYNAFAMTVVERTREFGMLRTIGMTRRQVMGQVFTEAALLGLIGSSLGIGFGILLARGLTRFMEIIFNSPLGGIQVSTMDLLVSFLLGIGVTFLAAGIPAWQAGRISAIEALRVRGKSKEGWLIKYGWIPGILLLGLSAVILLINPFPYDVQFRLGSMTVFGLFTGATLLIPVTVGVWERVTRPILKLIYGSSGSLGSRNVQRSKQRTTLTVAALMVGVAMVVIVRGMTDSFSSDLQTWIKAYMGGDIYVTSSMKLRSELERRLQAMDGVLAVAPIRYFNVEWQMPDGEKDTLQFMAVDVDAYTKVTNFVFSGKQVNPEIALARVRNDQAVFVASVLSEKFGLSPGGTIRLKTRRGYKDFEIAGVVVDFANQGMVVQGGWETMRRNFDITDANTLLLKIQPDADILEVKNRIDALYGNRFNITLASNEVIRDSVLTMMDQAFRMFDVMALISIVVGSLGVVNTLTMSVIERTREIGMLRAIGTTRGQIIRMVLAESGLIGVIGGALGIATGTILARILFIGMNTMSGYQLTFLLPPEAILISLVIALIISQLAALSPARRASKVRILEAVQYE